MYAIHVTSKDIQTGSLLVSNQTQQQTYKLVFELYNRVALRLGINLFPSYGYAYRTGQPKIKSFSGVSKFYLVESSDVLACDLNFSVYVTMESFLSARQYDGRTLQERLSNREQCVMSRAEAYFKNPVPIEREELISPSWKIVRRIAFEDIQDDTFSN